MKNPPQIFAAIPGFILCMLFGNLHCMASSDPFTGYKAVPLLIDLRSTFSDGAHSIDELAEMAHSKGFKAILINDHDRSGLSCGIPPFRVFSLLGAIDYNPFRSSPFSACKGDQGIKPYQELIHYVNEKGGAVLLELPRAEVRITP